MAEDFDRYSPLIGMEFSNISVGRYGIDLSFQKHEETGTREIKLSSMADICLNEKNLFKSAGDHNIVRPSDMPDLHDALGNKVIGFKPLGKKRACKIDLGSCSVFSWAGSEELPDHLFIAHESFRSEQVNWWLIDDE